jgi:hypothetical protein
VRLYGITSMRQVYMVFLCTNAIIYVYIILVVLCYVYSDYVGVEAGAMSFIVD